MSVDTADAPELNDRSQGSSSTYDAFLSYSHRDGAVAAGIHKGLHHIGRQVGRLNALRVFRDSTDLAANPDLWGKVTDAMERSRYLIVVLSPRAAASEWVDKEVVHWLQRRGPDQLLIVLAEGHLDWDEATGRFDPDRSDVALPVLTERGVLPTEPLYVDVTDDAPWDPNAPTFRDKVTDLAAPIHGKSKYELASDDVREQRRFRRLRRAAIIGLAMLTVIAVVAAVVAFFQRQEAIQQRQEAIHQRNEATARQLMSDAQSMLAGVRPGTEVQALEEVACRPSPRIHARQRRVVPRHRGQGQGSQDHRCRRSTRQRGISPGRQANRLRSPRWEHTGLGCGNWQRDRRTDGRPQGLGQHCGFQPRRKTHRLRQQ